MQKFATIVGQSEIWFFGKTDGSGEWRRTSIASRWISSGRFELRTVTDDGLVAGREAEVDGGGSGGSLPRFELVLSKKL